MCGCGGCTLVKGVEIASLLLIIQGIQKISFACRLLLMCKIMQGKTQICKERGSLAKCPHACVDTSTHSLSHLYSEYSQLARTHGIQGRTSCVTKRRHMATLVGLNQ